MKPNIALLLIGVLCIAAGLGGAVYCYVQYQMTVGATVIGLIGAGAGGQLISAALAPAKLCAKCGEPLKKKRSA